MPYRRLHVDLLRTASDLCRGMSAHHADVPTPRRTHDHRPTVPSLLQALRDLAADPDLPALIEPDAVERRWVEVPIGPDLQAWLISWPAGTATGWHDHGAAAAGAFATLSGRLTEYTWHSGRYVRTLGPGRTAPSRPGTSTTCATWPARPRSRCTSTRRG